MYHRVGPLRAGAPWITNALTVPSPVFAAQMGWLHAHGYHAITQEQLLAGLEGGRLPQRPVLITFDDGYRDVLWNAAPVLRHLRMPATAYVITDRISSGDPSFLTWRELRELEACGVEIGSHTVHHLRLATLSPRQATHELTASKLVLENRLRRPVPWLAYPHGSRDGLVELLAQRAGYRLAVTTSPGDLQSAAQPLDLHRFEIRSTTGVAGLRTLLASTR